MAVLVVGSSRPPDNSAQGALGALWAGKKRHHHAQQPARIKTGSSQTTFVFNGRLMDQQSRLTLAQLPALPEPYFVGRIRPQGSERRVESKREGSLPFSPVFKDRSHSPLDTLNRAC